MSYTCALGTFSRYTRYYSTQAPFQASKFHCPFGLSLASASLVCQYRLLISLLTDTFEIWENCQLKSFIFGQCLNSEKLCLDLMHLSGVILLTIMMHSQFWSSYISSSHFLTFSQIPVLDVRVALDLILWHWKLCSRICSNSSAGWVPYSICVSAMPRIWNEAMVIVFSSLQELSKGIGADGPWCVFEEQLLKT